MRCKRFDILGSLLTAEQTLLELFGFELERPVSVFHPIHKGLNVSPIHQAVAIEVAMQAAGLRCDVSGVGDDCRFVGLENGDPILDCLVNRPVSQETRRHENQCHGRCRRQRSRYPHPGKPAARFAVGLRLQCLPGIRPLLRREDAIATGLSKLRQEPLN